MECIPSLRVENTQNEPLKSYLNIALFHVPNNEFEFYIVRRWDGGACAFGVASLPTSPIYDARPYLQTLGLRLRGFPLHVGKHFIEIPSHFFVPFLFPLQFFQPHCFCSLCDMEISMISGMDFKAWPLWVSVGECFKSIIWKKGVQTYMLLCTLDTVLFSPIFSLFLFVGPYV